MRKRPDLTPEQEQAAASFIEGANQQPRSEDTQQQREDYPWEAPRVREDVTKNYPLRLPEPLYLKLKFVSQQTGRSMNQICNEAVEASVETALEHIQGESRR